MKHRAKLRKVSISSEHLAVAIEAVAAMDLKEKEAICDTIYAAQPNLLGSVLVLSSLGSSMETVEVVLNILIVIHLAVANSGQVLATVSEENLERQLQRFIATVNFSEGLDELSISQSIRQTKAYRKEKVLLAYVLGVLQRSGLVNQQHENAKYPMLAALNFVNCIAT